MRLSKKRLNGRNYYILDNEGYYNGKIKILYDDSDKIRAEGQIEKGLKSGEWKHYYENGNIEKIENYKFGELNGIFMYYYETGEIKEKGNFKYDKKEGIWQSYFKNGNIKIETSYYLDKQTNGIWKKFYETGELMCECPVVDNKFFGDYK